MKTFITIFSILSSTVLVEAVFDIDELKSFNYGIDIRSEPVVMVSEGEEPPDMNTVKLTSKYGQAYQCSFPNTGEHEKQKEEAEKVAMETGIPDLLRPMESTTCLRKTKDWWSYEFCYGKQIKQFHLSDDGRIEGELILLGHFESEYNWDDDAEKSTDDKRSRVHRYHTQQYVNGSSCELNGKLRRTEVRFVCEEGSADYIARLDEPETCVYIMTIHTMKICHHPFLKSPTPTRTVTITCNPLLTVVQYQDYLDEMEAREEKQRLEAEKKEKIEEEKREKAKEQKRLKEEKAKYYQENQLKPDIRIFVHHRDEVISLEVNPAESVLSLKFKLLQKKNYPVNQQVLMYEGQFLKDGKTLAEYDIVQTTSISLALSSNHDITDDDVTDDDNDVSVEDEDDGMENIGKDSELLEDYSKILKAARGGDASEMKTVFKVVESTDDLKSFLKESVEAVKKLQKANRKKTTRDDESEYSEDDDEDDDDPDVDDMDKLGLDLDKDTEDILKLLAKAGDSDTESLETEDNDGDDDNVDDDVDDDDLEELDTEIKTLKERYKNRRDRLTDIKHKVRASMNEQYNQIIKEAKEELRQSGLESEEEETQNKAIKQLTKTIDNLLNKLDKTEKELESVDKELEQFAEYDADDKVKSIPPVKGSLDKFSALGPLKTDETDSRVKVRVSRLKRGDKNTATSLRSRQTEELEKSVQKELEKAGIGDGDKIQVKIITTGYIDGDDDTMHVLSEQESETFRNMIVDMIGGQSEVEKEQRKQDLQEENYSFVWGQDKQSNSDEGGVTDGVIDGESRSDTLTDTENTQAADTVLEPEPEDS